MSGWIMVNYDFGSWEEMAAVIFVVKIRARQLVLVQHGAVVFVELRGKETKFTLLQEGDWAVTTPQVPHTECVGGNAVVHTIKFGDCSNSDWIPSLELDAKTKSLSFEEACQKCQSR